MTVNVAVLASGTGTNLKAIIDFNAHLGAQSSAVISVVCSNTASAGALEKARASGIAAETFDASDDGSALLALLDKYSVDLVVLAGYVKRLPEKVIARCHSRIINIHPGLLPEFGGAGMYGSRVHQAVIASGTASSGVTVHFVDEEFDHGPMIAQWRIAVNENETAESLASRVLEVEHIFYPRVVELVASLNDKKIFADY